MINLPKIAQKGYHTMDTLNLNTKPNKGIHLNYDERMFIQIRLQDGWSRTK